MKLEKAVEIINNMIEIAEGSNNWDLQLNEDEINALKTVRNYIYRQNNMYDKLSKKDIEEERNQKGFYYCGEEVSWNEIPLDVRKHDYPYYFDKNGNDRYPEIVN